MKKMSMRKDLNDMRKIFHMAIMTIWLTSVLIVMYLFYGVEKDDINFIFRGYTDGESE